MNVLSQDTTIEIIHKLKDENITLLTAMGIATFGGLVSWLRQEGQRSFSRLIVVLCTAAFAGLLAYYLTNAMEVSEQYQCAISGIAGYGGGTLLDEAVNKIKGVINGKSKQ